MRESLRRAVFPMDMQLLFLGSGEPAVIEPVIPMQRTGSTEKIRRSADAPEK